MGLVERDAGLEGLASVDGWCFVGLKGFDVDCLLWLFNLEKVNPFFFQ
jgi:hypothetical protein